MLKLYNKNIENLFLFNNTYFVYKVGQF